MPSYPVFCQPPISHSLAKFTPSNLLLILMLKPICTHMLCLPSFLLLSSMAKILPAFWISKISQLTTMYVIQYIEYYYLLLFKRISLSLCKQFCLGGMYFLICSSDNKFFICSIYVLRKKKYTYIIYNLPLSLSLSLS